MSSQVSDTTFPKPTLSAEDERWKQWKEWKQRKKWEEFCRWEEERGQHRLSTAEDKSSILLNTGETTKYVLAGQPTGWAAMDKAIHEYDEDKVKDCKEDIDNLLVFAGLFSAILTAFLIESYPGLLGDTSGQNALALLQGGRISIAAAPVSPPTPFRPSTLDIRVNVLWFASLLLALISASFGILVKQWLREYMAVTNPSPQARLRLRHLRYPALATWKVFEIAAILPNILHLSLALFFVGLYYFASSVHSSIKITTIPLISAWGVCFFAVTFLPLLFPRCPYRSTLLIRPFALFHRSVQWSTNHVGHWISTHCLQRLPSNDTDPWYTRIKTCFWATLRAWLKGAEHACQRADEVEVTLSDQKDLKVLSDADAIQSNDELLVAEISEAAGQVDIAKLNAHATLKFVRELLRNRLSLSSLPDDDDNDSPHAYDELIIDLRGTTLLRRTQNAVIRIILDFLPRLPSSFKGLPGVADVQGKGRPGDASYLRPRLLFALLLSLSGESLDQVGFLVDHLSQQKRGREIVSMFNPASSSKSTATHLLPWKQNKMLSGLLRGLSIVYRSLIPPMFRQGTLEYNIAHRDAQKPEKASARNLAHGLCLVHMSVKAQWSLTQVLRSVGPTKEKYPGHNPQSGEPELLKHTLQTLGSKAMGYVISLESWTGPLDRSVLESMLKSLCSAIQNRIKSYDSASALTEYQCITGDTGGKVTVDSITLDNAVTFLCLQSLRPQWFRPEKCWSCLIPSLLCTSESRNYILARAVFGVPVLGILRLCWRAATHSHVSGVRIINGLDNVTLYNWKSALQLNLKDRDLARHDNTFALKLLSFSIYLYIFGTPRLLGITKTEKQAWKMVFDEFAAVLHDPNTQSEEELCDDPMHCHRTPSSAMATVCLELIRFEEILARILIQSPGTKDPAGMEFKNYAKFRYAPKRMINTTVIQGWDFPPLCSVFPQALISALKALAEPRWKQPISEEISRSTEIRFHNYCIAYDNRIRELMKLKGIWFSTGQTCTRFATRRRCTR
ncbi:hypothetical protein BDY19DRAFT_109447 [Irpex rosettiformis]|uniref:Uncharacterized protein n=1 Tax=Irpex rosettiformis TaxID=378272 RepID=A0ACB8U606_9APHY|nr:hypothetical protein BDY19DRAFT_109447 [Irpex rosettiformis]